MKRTFGKILLLIPACLIVLLVGAFLTKKAKAEEAAEKIRKLPLLTLTDINGKAFSTAHLARGPLLLTFFHPDCEFCKYEISALIANDDISEKLIILLVSYADMNEILSFVKQVGIKDSSGMHIIHDSDLKFSNMFGADIIPANYMYNDSLELVKVFKGSVRPETILKYLTNND